MATSKYKLPNFKFYKPKKIKKVAKKIEKETDKRLSEIANNRFERALKYFKENHKLKRRHYKILSYYLATLKEEYPKLYQLYLKQAKVFFKTKGRYYYHLKAMLSSYYAEFKDEKLFNLLKLVTENNNKWKNEIAVVKELLQKADISRDFFSKVVNKINGFDSIIKIENLKDELLMNNNNSLLIQAIFNSCLTRLDSGVKRVDNDFCIKLLKDYLPLNKQKKVFEKILLDNKELNNFDAMDYQLTRWFNLIGETLGGPYGKNSAKWANIDQRARNLFKRWKAYEDITVFFSEISGDQRRLDFWRKYSDYFHRVEYFKQYDQALLMESNSHIFIEFAGGGALYMYDKDDLNIQDVIEQKYKYSNTAMVGDVLKDRGLCKERLIHKYNWESKFANEFIGYGYRPESEEKIILVDDIVKHKKNKTRARVKEIRNSKIIVITSKNTEEIWKIDNSKFVRKGNVTY